MRSCQPQQQQRFVLGVELGLHGLVAAEQARGSRRGARGPSRRRARELVGAERAGRLRAATTSASAAAFMSVLAQSSITWRGVAVARACARTCRSSAVMQRRVKLQAMDDAGRARRAARAAAAGRAGAPARRPSPGTSAPGRASPGAPAGRGSRSRAAPARRPGRASRASRSRGSSYARYAMRCSATVVLPEPAVPRITTKPDDGLRDQVELLRIDQPGDVGQVLVGAAAEALAAGAELPRLGAADVVRAQRGTLAAREARRFGVRAGASRPPVPSSAWKMPSGASMRRSWRSRIVTVRRASDHAVPSCARRSPPRTPRPAGSDRRRARWARSASRRSDSPGRSRVVLPSRMSCTALVLAQAEVREVGRRDVDGLGALGRP